MIYEILEESYNVTVITRRSLFCKFSYRELIEICVIDLQKLCRGIAELIFTA